MLELDSGDRGQPILHDSSFAFCDGDCLRLVNSDAKPIAKFFEVKSWVTRGVRYHFIQYAGIILS